jgi:predicted transcriptional regulator
LLGLIDNHTAGSAIEVKSSTIESVSTLLDRLAVAKLEPQERSWTALLRRIWQRVLEHSTDRNYEAGRIKAVAAFEPYTSVLKRHKQCGGDSEECVELVSTVRRDIETLVKEEKSPMVLRVLNPATSSILRML